MQLQSLELFTWVDTQHEQSGPIHMRVIRHTLVQESGLIYYQDEYIKRYERSDTISSERTGWTLIPSPATPDEPIGVFEYAGLIGAIMRSGRAYIFAAKEPNPQDEDEMIAFHLFQKTHRMHAWPHEWVEFHRPLPETLAYLGQG